jgi:hypothetical protein
MPRDCRRHHHMYTQIIRTLKLRNTTLTGPFLSFRLSCGWPLQILMSLKISRTKLLEGYALILSIHRTLHKKVSEYRRTRSCCWLCKVQRSDCCFLPPHFIHRKVGSDTEHSHGMYHFTSLPYPRRLGLGGRWVV